MSEKSTVQLLEIMRRSGDYHAFTADNRGEYVHLRVDRALTSAVREHGLNKADVIARSCVETHYAYQIFSGVKVPSRDKVLMLCRGMLLTFDEVQQLLKVTGEAPLYVKNERDNAIAFGFMKNLGIIEINNLLYELGLPLLT